MEEGQFFVKPRPKRSLLGPPSKKRKIIHKIEEINFDDTSRADYLTGFHKRKVARAKLAQEQAAKIAKEEKNTMKRQLRDDRKRELEEHVNAVNALLDVAHGPLLGLDNPDSDEGNTWNGIPDEEPRELVDHEEEYIDEDRYTTVTVEEVDISKLDGVKKIAEVGSEDEQGDGTTGNTVTQEVKTPKKTWPKKPAKKKFRYETVGERKLARGKLMAGKKARAAARREANG